MILLFVEWIETMGRHKSLFVQHIEYGFNVIMLLCLVYCPIYLNLIFHLAALSFQNDDKKRDAITFY